MEEDDRETMRKLEVHREAICNQINVRRLLDRMRSHSIFTVNECEEILNEMLNPNTFTKAGCFLDNLQRKGLSGYNVFLEYLGETYPSLYKTITGSEPDAPVNVTSKSVCGCVFKYTFPGNKVGDMIGDLTQQVADMHRELDLSNQLKVEQEREIQSLNQALITANKKAEKYDKTEKGRRRAELKVSVLEADIRTLLGNSLLHKEEKDRAMESLREKIKEVHDLERRLQQAKDQAELRRQIWQKTCMDKEQLKVDKEEMLQQMSTMEEKLKQAKWHEDVHKSVVSEDFQLDQHMQATINILQKDLKDYKDKCEELAYNLLQARNDLHRSETKIEKCKSETEELRQKEETAKKMVELYKKQYTVTWQDLNRVKQQRNRALDDRDIAQRECKIQLEQLHKQQEVMHLQLQNLESLYPIQYHTNENEVEVQQHVDNAECASPCNTVLETNVTDVVSQTDCETLSPSNLSDLPPQPRPRGYNILRQADTSDQAFNENTFPAEYFPYTTDVLDETNALNPWLQRHNSTAFGDSKIVHAGSIKSPNLLSLWEESFLDDDDLNEKIAEDDEKITQSPHQNLHRRSQSWSNLISSKLNSAAEESIQGISSKHTKTRAFSFKNYLSKSFLKNS